MVKIWHPSLQLPYLVMIVKNMKKYFTFEVQVLDDKNVRRRFRASNYQSTTRVRENVGCAISERTPALERTYSLASDYLR